jgi:hypothetical protein
VWSPWIFMFTHNLKSLYSFYIPCLRWNNPFFTPISINL